MDRERKTKAELNYGLRTTMVSGADEGAFVTVYICALSTSPRNFATFNNRLLKVAKFLGLVDRVYT